MGVVQLASWSRIASEVVASDGKSCCDHHRCDEVEAGSVKEAKRTVRWLSHVWAPHLKF